MTSARPVTPAKDAIRFDPEIREWAVRMAAIEMKERGAADAIANVVAKVGCTAATLRRWMREAERAGGIRPGVFTNPRRRVSELEAEVAALRAHNARLTIEKHRGAWGSLIIGAPLADARPDFAADTPEPATLASRRPPPPDRHAAGEPTAPHAASA